MLHERAGGLPGIIVWTTCDLIIFIICMGIFYGLFRNLFEFQRKWIFIQPNDRHNWIIRPSNITAIASILSSLAFAVSAAIAIIGTFTTLYHFEINIYIPLKIACLFKYIYLLSRIRNMMEQEPLFKANISLKLWILSIIFAIIKFGSWLMYFLFYFAPRDSDVDTGVTYIYEWS